MGDHLCFAWVEGNALLTGDMVMGWATTMVSPPDGDLAAFRASIKRLRDRREAVFYPGHGKPVRDPRTLLDWLLAHREKREAEILGVLVAGAALGAGLSLATSWFATSATRLIIQLS